MRFLCFALLLFLLENKTPDLEKFQITGYAQGTTYHISYYASHNIILKSQTDSVLAAIDSSLSLYKPYSLVSQFNNSATGIPVDDHFIRVVNAAQETYRQTNGLFDITVYPLTEAWGFGPVKKESTPDTAGIRRLLTCVGSDFLHFEGKKLVKSKPCVKIDPNGIAQGYSVDVLADFLEQNGIDNYLVELGGEIRIKGHNPGDKKKSIGIEAPGDLPGPSLVEKIIWLDKGAITTSGTYRRYHESNGTRISHLLDPRSGYPLKNELISVSVYAKDAMTADAYDNALMGMGLSAGLSFVEKREDLAAFFIYRKGDGSVADTASKRFYGFFKP